MTRGKVKEDSKKERKGKRSDGVFPGGGWQERFEEELSCLREPSSGGRVGRGCKVRKKH